MRVHGNYKIKRRIGLDQRNYVKYEPELREDFHRMCGYCGKSEAITKKGFEIDHFIPQKLAENLTDCYDNLVYSCFTCNRKKGVKWPTKDTTLPHDGSIGLCDPATDEFDTHLRRNDDGKIVSCSDVGAYMLKNVFLFDKRPTEMVWKAMQIIEMKQELCSRLERLAPEEKDEYIKLDQELGSLLGYIFEKKE